MHIGILSLESCVGVLDPPPVKCVDSPQVIITLRCLQDSDLVVGLTTIFGKWFTSLLCLLKGPEIILKAYQKVGRTGSHDGSTLNVEQATGKAFAIPTLNYYICVSGIEQINELRNAPSHQFSFMEFLEEVRSCFAENSSNDECS